MKICICGGGNLGHVIAGFIAAQQQHDVCMLTRHPERWQQQLCIETPDRGLLEGRLDGIYNDPQKAVADADIVLLCLPGFSICEVLRQIKDYLQPQTAVGSVVSSTGFFFGAMQLLPACNPLFGFQRVPFIARTIDYGHRARLTGYKNKLHLAVEHCDHPEPLRQALEAMLRTPIKLLDSFYEASISNSNPLLHPSRIYSMWKDWHEDITYSRIPLFYEEWTDEASRLYIDMDRELHVLLRKLPVSEGSIPTVLEYYESTDAATLTRKLQSIEAFKGIPAPMKPVGGGYVPDLQSRYFTEDFPYGLAIIDRLAKEHHVEAPTIRQLCQWGEQLIATHAHATE